MTFMSLATFIARRSPPVSVVALALVCLCGNTAQAQKIQTHNTYGSPIDTLMNTHLTTNVPEAKDFVKETSPDKRSLDYTPLTSSSNPDPDRPKPRDKAGVEALRAELESAGARNEKRAKGVAAPKRLVVRKVKPSMDDPVR